MFKRISLPIQLLLVIIGSLLLGNYLSEYQISVCYTFSLFFKEILGFFLPFIIFTFVLSGILSFKKSAHIVLMVMLGCIFTSNILVSMVSFGIGKILLAWLYDGASAQIITAQNGLVPLYKPSFPALVGSEKAMLLAVVLGIGASFVRIPWLEKIIMLFKAIIETILNRFLIPLLPLYVLGFLLKLFYEGALGTLFHSYGKAFILMLCLQVCVLSFLYLLSRGFNIKRALQSIKNSVPSYLAAFSTMSSTAAIPVTVNCMEKNIGSRPLSSVAAPIMANIHLAGDSITVPIFALVTTSLFLGMMPTTATFITFVFYFCIAMLAVSGVPGGGIIVMIPILKSILGFTPDMISVITALYLLQDAFGTAGNVMGDGALVIIVNKILKKLRVL